MRLLVLFFCLSFFTSLNAEEDAFFSVDKDGEKVIVEATFPRTLRNELIDFDETLISAQSFDSFVNVLNDYIAKKLVFYSATDSSELFNVIENNSLDLNAVEFLIEFNLKGEIIGFRNEIMLNVYPKHRNYHRFLKSSFLPADSIVSTTRQFKKVSFIEEENNQDEFYYFMIVPLILLVIVAFLLFKRMR